jgi:putative two-component system response regulator
MGHRESPAHGPASVEAPPPGGLSSLPAKRLMKPEGMMSGTILVVDDQPCDRTLLEEVLQAQGFQVETAPDGQEALEKFPRVQPDLVLLDAMMPNLNGYEVCRRLKTDPKTRLTPIVLVTSKTETSDRVRGLEVGADDILGKPVDRGELLARVRSLLNLKAYTDELERAESVLFALALSIEAKDPYTEGHCDRLARMSVELGRRASLNEEQLVALYRGGIVHDIGKIAVPDAILLKPARLTPQEMRVIREHPVVGERICAPLKSFKLVLPIIRHHHEKLDGSGYPDGLRGDAIPITARVLQIVDVFDALTTERPYKFSMSIPEALEVMREEVRRGWWDPEVFAVFERFAPSFRAEGRH